MFVSDAHLFVPREIRWTPIMAIRFSAIRRRKSLARRIRRDIRMVLPVVALAFTFAVTVALAELATLVVPTGAGQSPAAESMQQAVARLFAPSEPVPAVVERPVASTPAPRLPRVSASRGSVAMLD